MRLTAKSQVTIPLDVRRQLGIGPGSEVEISAQGQRAVLKPKRAAATQRAAELPAWIKKMSGAGNGRYRADALMRLTRGDD